MIFLSPCIRYFDAVLRFVAIYALFFGDLCAKKCFFGSKTVFLVQEMHFDMVCIAYYTDSNLQLCAKQRICCEKSKYELDESFYGHFCPRGKAANFCHPGHCPPPMTPIWAFWSSFLFMLLLRGPLFKVRLTKREGLQKCWMWGGEGVI